MLPKVSPETLTKVLSEINLDFSSRSLSFSGSSHKVSSKIMTKVSSPWILPDLPSEILLTRIISEVPLQNLQKFHQKFIPKILRDFFGSFSGSSCTTFTEYFSESSQDNYPGITSQVTPNILSEDLRRRGRGERRRGRTRQRRERLRQCSRRR